jgi:hypothetical protein
MLLVFPNKTGPRLVLFFFILLTKLAAKLLPSFKEEKNRMLLMGSELRSIGWVGGVVMHLTT